MKRRPILFGPLAVALLLLGSGSSSAQTERGAIVGTVTDATGAVVPGATVTVTNAGTNVTQTYVTNNQGFYEAPFLNPGPYKVTVSLSGFQDVVIENIEVNVAQRVRADARLVATGIQEAVTVVARPSLVQTESASVGQIVDNRLITELPSGDRNVYQFLTLTSTVAAPPGGNAPAFRTESGGSFSISGTRPSSITFKIDGLSNTDPGFGTPTITPTLDSVQEFHLQNIAYSAEFEGIGQINIATKSGTSAFHGTLTEFFRNERLQPKNPLINARTRLRFNQFGGTLGGPVHPWNDRTFFFFSYEGRRQDSLGIGRATVFTQAQRNGDFSATLGGCVMVGGVAVPQLLPSGLSSGDCVRVGQIFDPQTTVANPLFDATRPVSAFNPQFIRQPFANNRVPAGQISSVARSLIEQQLPLPDLDDPIGPNFTGRAGAKFDNDQYSIRIDHSLSNRDRVYGRLAIQDNFRISRPTLRYQQKTVQGKGRVFSSTWNRIFGSSAVNEFRIGYVRGIYGDTLEEEIDPKRFGFQNTFLNTLPRFALPGNINYGGFSASILAETQDTYQLANHLSLVRGRHAIKVGFQLDYNQFENGELGNNTAGTAVFTGLYTLANNGLTPTREQGYADFLLGLAQSSSLNPPAVAKISNMPWFVYVQDDWKINDRLSVSAGLRYEYHQPWKEASLGGAFFDPSGGGRLFVVDPEVASLSETPLVVCCAPRRAVEADRNDFAPRVSFVLRPLERDSAVIRVGYGLYYSDMTQFFAWRQYEPLRGIRFQTLSGDFLGPGARLENLFPESAFLEGGGVRAFFPAGVDPAVLGDQPVIGFSTLGSNRTSYAHQWSVSVQRELLPRMLIDLTYQGSIGRNLPIQWIFNQPTASPVPVNNASADPAANPWLRRPFTCCTTGSFVVANLLESKYNAFTAKVDKRFSGGYQLLSSYTWSRSIDQGSEVFRVNNAWNILTNNRDFDADRGRSSFDVPHRWVTSGVVELPFGQGKRFLNRGDWVSALVGGFRVSSVFTLQSGFPFSPSSRALLRANTGVAIGGERGDLVGDPDWPKSEWDRLVDDWRSGRSNRLYLINPDAISLQYPLGTFGNIPRNFFRAPYGRSLDLSIAKTNRLAGTTSLEVRADILNVTSERLHRTDLSVVVRAVDFLGIVNGVPNYGWIPGYREMFNPRVIQLSARLKF